MTSQPDLGVQAIQDFNFQIYEMGSVTARRETQHFCFGNAQGIGGGLHTLEESTSNQNLLIGAGALGVALILAGAWMYLRDRNRGEESRCDEEEADEFEILRGCDRCHHRAR